MRRLGMLVILGTWAGGWAAGARADYGNTMVPTSDSIGQSQAAQQAAQNYLQQSQQEFALGAAAIANGLAAAKTACNKPLPPAPVAAADPPPPDGATPPGDRSIVRAVDGDGRGNNDPSTPPPSGGPTWYGSGAGPVGGTVPYGGPTGSGGPVGSDHATSVPEPKY